MIALRQTLAKDIDDCLGTDIDDIDAFCQTRLADNCLATDTPGTVCSWEAEGGINSMTQRVPLANARLFHNAAHSIHNTVRSERMLMLNHDSGEGACSERSKRALP